MYLDPFISAERHLLQDLHVHSISSGVLHHKGVGVCYGAGLGPAQSATFSVMDRGNRLTRDTDTLVHAQRGRELLIGRNITKIRLQTIKSLFVGVASSLA